MGKSWSSLDSYLNHTGELQVYRETLSQKLRWGATEENTPCQSLLSTCMYTLMNIYSTYGHIPKIKIRISSWGDGSTNKMFASEVRGPES